MCSGWLTPGVCDESILNLNQFYLKQILFKTCAFFKVLLLYSKLREQFFLFIRNFLYFLSEVEVLMRFTLN